MKLRTRSGLTFLALAFSVATFACGGAATQAAPSTPSADDVRAAKPGSPSAKSKASKGGAASTSSETAPVAEKAVAVEPEPVPGERVFLARWKNPRATLGTLTGFAKVPRKVTEQLPQKMAAKLIGDVRRHVDRKAFAKNVVMSAPLDFAVVVDTSKRRRMPKPVAGYSVGLRSLDAARAAVTGELTPMGKHMWLIGAKDGYGTRCAIAASTGGTSARLVCGERMRDLEKIGAYMARTLPTVNTPDVDMFATLELRSVLDVYGSKLAAQAQGLQVFAREIKIGIPTFDDAITTAMAALADEAGALIADADSIVAKIDLDAKRGMTVSVGSKFAGSKAWLVQTLVDGAELRATAPDMFWRLPKSSFSLFHARTGDPARFTGIIETLRQLVEGGLEKVGAFSSRDRRDIAALLRVTGEKHKSVVQAQGQRTSDSLGWYLIGSEGSPKLQRAWLKDFVSVYNRATVQAQLRRMLNEMSKKEKVKLKLPTVRRVPSSRALGAGALTVRVSIQIPKKLVAELAKEAKSVKLPASGKIDLYLISATDDKGHWVAVGSDKAHLTKLISDARAGKNSIVKSENLAFLKTDKHNMAGVFFLRGMLDKVVRELAIEKPNDDKVKVIRKIIAGLPNKGETPIVMFADSRAGDRPSAELTVKLKRGSLVDVGWAVTKAFELVMSSGKRGGPQPLGKP